VTKPNQVCSVFIGERRACRRKPLKAPRESVRHSDCEAASQEGGRMMKASTIGLCVALVLAVATKEARACSGGNGGLNSAAVAQLGEAFGISVLASAHVANFVYTGHDILRRGHFRRRDGVGEVATMVPAIVLGLASLGVGIAVQASQSGVIGQRGLDPIGGTLLISGGIQSLWSIGLLAHGIYVMRTAPDIADDKDQEKERVARLSQPSFSFMPTMVSDGKSYGLGLGVGGRF
jgi:hypothetical protein